MISGDAVSISRKNGAERDRVISKAFSSAKPVVGHDGSDLFLSVKFRPKNHDGKSEIAVSGLSNQSFWQYMVDCSFACAKAVELFILFVRRFLTPL